MKPTAGRLKNWRIVEGQAYGDIFGDTRFKNGEPIHTSAIDSIILITRNTVYVLDPEDQQDTSLKRYVGREG